MLEIPNFETFEDFFEWIKTLSSETIKENELKILSYHNLKYQKFFNLNGWTFDNFKKFWAYVNKTQYYEDVKQVEIAVENKGIRKISEANEQIQKVELKLSEENHKNLETELEFKKIPDVDTIENDEFDPEKLETNEASNKECDWDEIEEEIRKSFQKERGK